MAVCPQGHDSSTDDYCSFCGLPVPGASGTAGASPVGAGQGGSLSAALLGEPGQPGEATQASTVCRNCACPLPVGGRYCEECGWDQNQPGPSPGAPAPEASFPAPAPPPAPAPEPVVETEPGPAPVAPQGPAPVSPAVAGGVPTQPTGAPEPGRAGGSESADEEWTITPPATAHGTWVAVIATDHTYFQTVLERSGPDAQALSFPPSSPEKRIPLRGPQMRIGRRRLKTGTIPEIDLATTPEDPGVSHDHAVLREEADGSWVVIDRNAANGTTLNYSPDPIVPEQPIVLADGDRLHVGAWTTITLHRL